MTAGLNFPPPRRRRRAHSRGIDRPRAADGAAGRGAGGQAQHTRVPGWRGRRLGRMANLGRPQRHRPAAEGGCGRGICRRRRLDGMGCRRAAGYYLKPGQRNTRLEITASGSVQVPAYVRRVYVRAIGGGGGGAYSHQGATENTPSYGTVYIGSGGGAGGGAGEYYEGELAVAPGIPLAITIGAGGGPGSSTTDGTAGGQTLIQQGASVLKACRAEVGAVAPRTPSAVFRGGRRTAGRHRHGLVRGLSGYASPPGNGGGGGFAIRRGGLADIDRVPQLCRRRRLSAFPRLGRGGEAVVRWAPPMAIRDWRGGTLRRRHIEY